MKVLHVIPSISGQAGGPSQAILPMCRALREQGVDLLLATTDDGLSGESGTAILQHGQISDYKGQPTIFFPRQIGASFKYSRPFAQWLNSNVANYDLVHIHAVFNHACIAAARACRKRGVPYIVRPLGTLDPWSMKQKSLRKKVFWHAGVKRMLTNAAAIQYTAKSEQQAVEESLSLNHGVVVPLGIEIKANEGLEAVKDFSQFPSLREHPYVLVLSRLLPTKGLDVLLDAFLSLLKRREFQSWRLLLAGEGPPEYVASLKRMVEEQHATEFVVFAGWLDGEMKEAALRNASLLALPSYHENFGLCVMESLARGVPVLISPHVNLAPEIEAAGAGWIAAVEKHSIESTLAEALAREDERAKRGRAGKTLSLEFSCERVATRLNEMYSSVSAIQN